MAKMKVHELAKELEIQSKDIVTFLQEKGFEVKAAQSSVEDEQIQLVRTKFKKVLKAEEKMEEKKTEEKKTAEAAQEKKAPVKEETEKKTGEEDKKAGDKETGNKENGNKENGNKEAAPVKKKRNIIFVSNPQNSKMPGGQRPPMPPQRPARAQQTARPAGQPQQKSAAAPAQKSPAPQSAPAAQSVQETAKPKEAQNVAAQSDLTKNAAVQNQTQNQTQNQIQKQSAGAPVSQSTAPTQNAPRRTDNPAYRPQGSQRPQSARTGYNNNNNNNGRPAQTGQAGGQNRQAGGYRNDRPNREGAPRNDQRGNAAGNRPFRNNAPGGAQNNRGPAGPGRSFNNNERPERRDGRPGNQFAKPAAGKSFGTEAPAKDMEKKREDEKRRIGQEKAKRSKKDHIYEDDSVNKNKPGRFIKPEKKAFDAKEEVIKVITLPETLTIKELAEKMKLQPSAIVKKLFLQGKIVTVNQEIPFETAEEIAIEYEVICEREVKVDVIEELLKEEEEETESLTTRPPVICVMGHVDHGKTSLLDAIRKTNVTDREAGGITQHIGAYTVHVNGQTITFLDTPGHEAFTAMRMRGANATDIAILVVAADDGVMPQTIEAINHAKAAGIEIIVAVNKVDKPNANVDRVKQELAEYELIPVDWGGTTEFVPVSAKAGNGIEDLLETIVLTAEILELKANPDRQARGLVIEAELDKGRGPVATILVQKGTLHVGDFISAGASHGKVRAMIDDKGRKVKEAGPSMPVEILGLSDVPNAGEVFLAHENDKTAKNFAETYLAQNKERMLEDTKSRMSLDDLFTQIQAGNLKELNLIIKADVQGSVEAVKQSLLKLSNEEILVKCIHGGVGAINESDVSLASASNAIIIGFNVRPDAMAKSVAEREGVDMRLYKVIYQAIEDVEAAMKGMLDPVFEEKVIGHAEVRQIFKASAIGNISGSYVLDGMFQRGCKVRITREGEQIFEGELASLKRFKDDVKEVKAGFECGLVFEGFDQIQELDIVEAYIMVEVPR